MILSLGPTTIFTRPNNFSLLRSKGGATLLLFQRRSKSPSVFVPYLLRRRAGVWLRVIFFGFLTPQRHIVCAVAWENPWNWEKKRNCLWISLFCGKKKLPPAAGWEKSNLSCRATTTTNSQRNSEPGSFHHFSHGHMASYIDIGGHGGPWTWELLVFRVSIAKI